MAFVRTKKVKGTDYAYIVENKWTKKGPRQKNKKYLGKVYYFNPKKDPKIDFSGYTKEATLYKIIEYELIRHGFKKKGNYFTNKINLILTEKSIKTHKPIVLGINEGFLCDYYLKKILKFKADGTNENMEELAKLFIQAGLTSNKEAFIEYYKKCITKNHQ